MKPEELSFKLTDIMSEYPPLLTRKSELFTASIFICCERIDQLVFQKALACIQFVDE
jgi:hypothetical protein